MVAREFDDRSSDALVVLPMTISVMIDDSLINAHGYMHPHHRHHMYPQFRSG